MIPKPLSSPHTGFALMMRLLLCIAVFPPAGMSKEGDARRKALAESESPFVRRHASDLVNWHLWEGATFEKARKEKKPLYVCIGYDSCHWCLRMQNESFNNPEVAAVLNENFVNVIVDRERRPLLDAGFMTYMNANQGQSGWPLNVWITPDGVPFSVGSYFPVETESGKSSLPEFTKVLDHITTQWDKFPEYIDAQSKRDLEKLIGRLKEMDELKEQAAIDRSKNPEAIRTAAYEAVATRYDPVNGGFSNPFQFPQPGIIRFLAALKKEAGESFRASQAEKMMTLTGMKMAAGGLFDHLEGGFHRYALDPAWEVPRFEKMLVAQASMADCYLRMYQSTGRRRFLDVARSTLSFVESNLDAGSGLMHGGLHSDSAPDASKPDELEEGYYYTWTYEDFVAAAGEAAPVLTYMMEVRPGGNLSPGGSTAKELAGRNVPRMAHSVAEAAEKFGKEETEVAELANAGLHRLAEARKKRPKPALDDNIVPGWNLLAASAFARTGAALEREGFAARAAECVESILERSYDAAEGKLYHVVKKDGSREGVYGFGYATMIQALLDLYETTLDEKWLQKAREIQEWQIKWFRDDSEKPGCFYEGIPGQKDDFLRIKSFTGDGGPSTNAISAFNLLRLAKLCGNEEWLVKSREIYSFSLPRQVAFPTSVPELLAIGYHLDEPSTLVLITGAADSPLARSVVKMFAGRLEFNTSLMRIASDTPLAMSLPTVKKIAENLPEKPSVFLVRDGNVSGPLGGIADLKAALSSK